MSTPHEQRQSRRRPSPSRPVAWGRAKAASLAGACTLAATGCGAADYDASPGSFAVTDSAGIEIVTSAGGGWAEGEGWTLGDAATVLGGSEDMFAAAGGEEPHELWMIRGFAPLPDGSFAVLSGGNHQVHVFDASGERVRVFGRQGEGPGEFQVAMSMAFVPPDTLLIMDLLELEILLLDGTWVGSEQVGLVRDAFGPATAVQPFGILPDRTIVGSALSRALQQAPIPEGVYRPGGGYALLTAHEREPVLLGWYEGREQERMEVGGRASNFIAPFGRSTVFAVTSWNDPRVLVADNERYEIQILDMEGTLERIVRRGYDPVAVEDRWIEAWKEAQRGSRWTQGQLPVLEQGWARMTVRETLPPLEGMTLDELGYLWVLRPSGMPQDPVTFDVFDPDGRYLGDLSVPGGLRPVPAPIIGEDYLMGVWADELDVETVRVYPLERGR